MAIPRDLFGEFFRTYMKIRTIYTNIGVSICFLFVIACFILSLLFMQRIFKVYRGKDSKEIKRRTIICGSIIILCILLRMSLCIFHVISFSLKLTSEESDKMTEHAVELLSYTDIILIILFKFIPSLAIIIMMNKPQCC